MKDSAYIRLSRPAHVLYYHNSVVELEESVDG